MKLEKNLLIEDFSKPKVGDSPYVMKADTSKLTFDKKTLKKYGIKPFTNLKGKTLTVTLNSRKVKKGEARTLTDITKKDVVIKNVDKLDRQSRVGIPMQGLSYMHNRLTYSAYFETFCSGGGVFPEPIPFYRLNLGLSEKEYSQLRELPSNTVMKFSCKVVD